MVVVFPAPFGPRKPWMVPAFTLRLSLSTAVKRPYFLVRLTVSIAESILTRPKIQGSFFLKPDIMEQMCRVGYKYLQVFFRG